MGRRLRELGLRALAFLVPAVLAGAAVAFLSAGADPDAPYPRERISAVPDVAPQSGATDDSSVRRVVTGRPSPAAAEPAPTEARPELPAWIAVPALGVDAAVKPVGATRDGIRVPPVDDAGWYRDGPRPGEPGRAVVLGHLDSLTGPAAFTPIPSAEPGTEVIVSDRAGVPHSFRVLRTLEVPKDRFPAEKVYGATRRPSLALITCGGDFDPRSGYENNVIVLARASGEG